MYPPAAITQKAVLWAVENGITEGTSDTTFASGIHLHESTRRSAPVPCGRQSGSQSAARHLPIVADSAYYADAVKWATEQGITSGISSSLFGPDATCTRAQIVTFLYRMYQGK